MPNSQVDVTAGAPTLRSYVDNGDGTVTDKITGLMWQQTLPVPVNTYSQATAAAYCAGLSLGGHSDWRLPALIELVSIVDLGTSSPSINLTYFPGTPSDYFWSSTPVAATPTSGWIIWFGPGSTVNGDVSLDQDVRCVR